MGLVVSVSANQFIRFPLILMRKKKEITVLYNCSRNQIIALNRIRDMTYPMLCLPFKTWFLIFHRLGFFFCFFPPSTVSLRLKPEVK